MLVALMEEKTFLDGMEKIKDSYWPSGKYFTDTVCYGLPFSQWFMSLFEQQKPGTVPDGIKSSANLGNYHHMINVVACAAHLIHHYTGEEKPYADGADYRKLTLMLSAYYHDVGKVIVNHRHDIEGKNFFMDPQAPVSFLFTEIFAHYGMTIKPETFSVIAEMVGAHAIFGTVSTGENGLICLADVIKRLSTLSHSAGLDVRKTVFDLWLLNVSDIMVSLENKWALQSFTKKPPGGCTEEISNFFTSAKGGYLLEDLTFALEIAEQEAVGGDGFDLARSLSERRAGERFLRLIRQTLGDEAECSKLHPGLKSAIARHLDSPFSLVEIEKILTREIGINWKGRLGIMGQFDYALGFFRKLASRAVYWIQTELAGEGGRTGWIQHHTGGEPPYSDEFIDKYNAECIINNFIMAVAQIIKEISILTADIGVWNIEFKEAAERLTGSKADNLLSLEGIYRSGSARMLLMRELMLYKG